jgi:MAS20 protein import receptor
VEETLEEGFPTDLEEREAYFMSQISQGEEMSSNGKEATCLSSLKVGVDSMVLQVQTRSQQHYAFTKASRSTQNQRL